MLLDAFLKISRLLISESFAAADAPAGRSGPGAEGAAAGAHLADTGRGCAAAGCGLLLLLRGQELGSSCSLEREVVTGACELPAVLPWAGPRTPAGAWQPRAALAPLADSLLPPHKLCNGASCLPAQGSCLWRLSRRAFSRYPAELLPGLRDRQGAAERPGSSSPAPHEVRPRRGPHELSQAVDEDGQAPSDPKRPGEAHPVLSTVHRRHFAEIQSPVEMPGFPH
ncbi:uncharacterized protein LOC128805479 isoform X2 [Vidua macroura]|uniref:uncharacterized protein LOC128805479 isoform X2 n=1 Tax=Vidua macroura TaxID=187451 RepID=UPI0023A90915|nr:uncharacterized protein LOC128805479 isoform X2 [Vidua macroura]